MVQLTEGQLEFMQQRIFASFALVSPTTGLPLNTTVWVHYYQPTEKFYVITNKTRAKWRFLRDGSKKIAINIVAPQGYPYFSMNGTAEVFFEEDREDFWDIILEIIEKYNAGNEVNRWLKRMKEAGDRLLVELEPDNIYSSV